MPDYRETNTEYTEELSVVIFKELGINVKRNNLSNKTAVDLISDKNKIRIDVQYSQNFKLYGDFRLDYVSAYSKGEKNKSFSSIELFKEFESRWGYKVDKVGKFFQDDYLDAIIILFYNEKINKNKIDKILIVNKEELLNYFNNNLNTFLNQIRLNRKESLGDSHGSAFIPINVVDLINYLECPFGTLEELLNDSDKIKKYLKY